MDTMTLLIMSFGIFIGNFAFHSIKNKNWKDGLIIGFLAAAIHFPLAYFLM
jgi:hypothetical protein